jgi:transposase
LNRKKTIRMSLETFKKMKSRGFTVRQIARMLEVGEETLRRHIKSKGWDTKKKVIVTRRIDAMTDRERNKLVQEVDHLYFEKCYSLDDIMEELNFKGRREFYKFRKTYCKCYFPDYTETQKNSRYTLKEELKEHDVSYATYKRRLYMEGMDKETALKKPVRKYQRLTDEQRQEIKERGMYPHLVQCRMSKGMTYEEALNKPYVPRKEREEAQ